MPFTSVAAGQIDLLQNAVDGDVFIPSFSRRSFLQGATAGLLSLAPALTMVGNLLTVDAPVRNYSLATFAGLGLSIETTVVAGNFPVVANRDVQVKNVASTGHTYTYPLTRKVGQLLVMAVATAALTTITTPSGWTLVQSQAGTESRSSIFTRVLDGLEPSTELLAFGTASGAVVRTWMIDIGDAPVEAVAGINDSAAGTSLDLATISPTWATTEAANTLYIAVLALANDVAVSAFPAGYTVTGQDVSASATANIDCALAYAERSALGSSENPGAFTYAAARSTGHILAIKPKVTARLNWDGLTVRKNSVTTVGTRRQVNLIEGSGVTLTMADDGTEIDITIAASSGSAHVLRDDGVDMTQRAAANFVTSTTITAILTDDAVNNETEITFQLGAHTGDVTSAANSLALTIANNAVTNAKAADMAALTVKANATNATADPQDVASAADDTVFRRTATTLNWGQLTVGMAPNDVWTYAKIQNVSATARILGRITAGAGDIEELTGTQATTLLDNFTSALKGLAPASGGGTVNFLRADGTWAAPPDTNTGHVIRDDGVGMTQRAALNFVSGAIAGNITFILADDAANGETEVTGTLAALAANTILANATNASAVPTAFAVAAESVVGRTSGDIQSITSSVQSILMRAAGSVFWGTAAADQVLRRSGSGDLGFGTLVTNNIGNDQVTYAKIQNVSATSRILGRITAAAGDIEELTGTQATTLLDNFTSLLKGLVPASGGGTTNFLRADGTFAAPPGTFTALSGAIVSTATGGATTFAGILDNGAAENNRTNLNFIAGTNTTATVTDDAGNDELEIRFNVDNFPLTGLADQAANTINANATAGAAPPTAVAISADSILARLGGNLVNTTLTSLCGPGLNYSAALHQLQVLIAAGSHLTTDVGSGVLRFSKDRIRDTWWEEFTFAQTLPGGTTVNTSGQLAHGQSTNWWMVASGASGTWGTTIDGTNVEHPGIWTLTSGATSGNALRLYNGVANTMGYEVYRGNQIYKAEAIIRMTSVTTKIWEFGFRDQTGDNFIEFYADTSAGVGSTTLVHTYTEEAGVATDNNTAITDTANAWMVLTILQETLGTIDFYIDDVLTNSHSTNVPDSEGMALYFQVATRAAVTRQLQIDYCMFESQNFANGRDV